MKISFPIQWIGLDKEEPSYTRRSSSAILFPVLESHLILFQNEQGRRVVHLPPPLIIPAMYLPRTLLHQPAYSPYRPEMLLEIRQFPPSPAPSSLYTSREHSWCSPTISGGEILQSSAQPHRLRLPTWWTCLSLVFWFSCRLRTVSATWHHFEYDR